MQKRKDEDDRSVLNEDEWTAYFEKISDVCPWSLEAWNNNEIRVFEGFEKVRPLIGKKAHLYLLPHFSDDDLYELAEDLNDVFEEYEFLWSHPDFTKGGNRAAPLPVLIQQDREYLEYLRGNKQKKT